VKLLADNPQGSVVIQADEKAMADTIIKVMDGSREGRCLQYFTRL
jgi:biopolymer transport protein ExbD